MIDRCVRGSHFPNLLVSNYRLVMKNCCVTAKNGTRVNVTVQLHSLKASLGTIDGKQGLPTVPSCGLIRVTYHHIAI